MYRESYPNNTVDGPSEVAKKRRKEETSGGKNFRWSYDMTRYLFGFLVDHQESKGLRRNKYAAATRVVNDQFDVGISET